MKIDDENFNAYIDVTSDDKWIESYVNYNNKAVSFTLTDVNIEHKFFENNNFVGIVSFDKNGINVTSNGGQVLKFSDRTNNLNVTFTVAELIALKALLQTA